MSNAPRPPVLHRPRAVLVEHLGARLAFKRAVTLLYDALLAKHRIEGGFPGGPTREDLEQHLAEERALVTLLESAIRALEGDPCGSTTGSRVEGTLASGIVAVAVDLRTDLAGSLKALLVAELTDHEGWASLAALAQSVQEHDLAPLLRDGLERDERHLAAVRGWIAAAQARAVARP